MLKLPAFPNISAALDISSQVKQAEEEILSLKQLLPRNSQGTDTMPAQTARD